MLLDILGEYSKHASNTRLSLPPSTAYTIEVDRSAHFIIMDVVRRYTDISVMRPRAHEGPTREREERAQGAVAVLKTWISPRAARW